MKSPTHDSPENENSRHTPLFWVTRRAARIALVALHAAALLVIAAEAIHPFTEDAHGVERVGALDFLASYAIYGFVACVILVLLGRLLRRGVMRDEDYYDGGH